MIENRKQYEITKTAWVKFHKALSGFDFEEAKIRCGSEVLAIAELEALVSEASELSRQIATYAVMNDEYGVLVGPDGLEGEADVLDNQYVFRREGTIFDTNAIWQCGQCHGLFPFVTNKDPKWCPYCGAERIDT